MDKFDRHVQDKLKLIVSEEVDLKLKEKQEGNKDKKKSKFCSFNKWKHPPKPQISPIKTRNLKTMSKSRTPKVKSLDERLFKDGRQSPVNFMIDEAYKSQVIGIKE